ncbi:MAG: hypothetical protein O2887_12590 [Bacteroidetes bacterium]|nr:hypothetical protein [Bacteroidota bacterium]MDA1121307.1 hypothetical protein [Bacteroidota bacterium]
MGPAEFIVTPFYLVIILVVGYLIRPNVTDQLTRRYFIPGLMVKLVGALSLGLIYQFYYKGGDTLNYYHLGSVHIWRAFLDSPSLAFKLIFLVGKEYESSTFQYASNIISYGDLPTYFVVRVAGLFSLVTFNSYYAISLLFASLSFSGSWALYYAFYKILPNKHFLIALAVLFVPSVFFWGSGLLKDTLTFGAMGWFIFSFLEIFVHKKRNPVNILVMVIAAYIIYTVKIYIMLSLVPALIIFLFLKTLNSLKSLALKVIVAPFIIGLAISSGYYAIIMVGEDNARYSIDDFVYTAQTTAEWLHYVSQIQGGSGYSLGDNDYSTAGIMGKFLPAVWVSLYRPYLWESHNLVMMISAIESFIMLLLSLWIVFKVGFFKTIRSIIASPFVTCLFLFTITFAFAIGFSTYNFGSLVRYKIPLIPLFLFALILLWEKATNFRSRAIGISI